MDFRARRVGVWMSWSFILQITECASGRPVDDATVHVKGYYEYEDQVPAESWTAIADGQGRLAIEAMDSVIVVDALVGKPGLVAGLFRVEPDTAGWQWCRACSALFFTGFGQGACNEGGGHDASESGGYYLYYERNPPGTQANWRWCNRCQALAFDDGTPGVYFDRGAHDHDGSGNYAVVHFP